ncbi:MAG: hypothetical protein KDJ54_18900 [Candidatus Competibacteraceae bacterium]|nr:hypothetical protein [Candidatus Competibacteraceae bacterium]
MTASGSLSGRGMSSGVLEAPALAMSRDGTGGVFIAALAMSRDGTGGVFIAALAMSRDGTGGVSIAALTPPMPDIGIGAEA